MRTPAQEDMMTGIVGSCKSKLTHSENSVTHDIKVKMAKVPSMGKIPEQCASKEIMEIISSSRKQSTISNT